MKIEPHSDMRQVATTAAQMTQAFKDVGYDEGQAFELTTIWFEGIWMQQNAS